MTQLEYEDIQKGVGAEYYVYRLATNPDGSYKPYYVQQQINNFTKVNSSLLFWQLLQKKLL